MNKSCNLIYFAGLILINCSNAADGYKPLPDPVYKKPTSVRLQRSATSTASVVAADTANKISTPHIADFCTIS